MSLEIRLISTRLGELTQEEKVERKEEGFPSKAWAISWGGKRLAKQPGMDQN